MDSAACEGGWLYTPSVLRQINALVAAFPECAQLTQPRLERVDAEAGAYGTRFRLWISVAQGEPSVFEYAFEYDYSIAATERVMAWVKLNQITRYARYEACTPPSARGVLPLRTAWDAGELRPARMPGSVRGARDRVLQPPALRRSLHDRV